MIISIVCAAICFLDQPNVLGDIKVLPEIGRTWKIIEKDALAELRDRASKVDMDAMRERMRERILNYRPPLSRMAEEHRLKRAEQYRTFLVDMTWTLDFDIPDGQGGILYPRGYTLNPLNFISYDQEKKMVVIDGTDPEQIKWLKSSQYLHDPKSKILLSDGLYREVRKEIKRHCYFLTWPMKERFNLKAVPAIIRKLDNEFMMVNEIAIKTEK